MSEVRVEWPLVELSDAGVMVLDCEHKTPKDAGVGHAYIAIPNLVDGQLDLSRVRRISEEDLAEWTRRTEPAGGDVLVTRRGRVGDTAVIPEGLTCAVGQNLVLLRSDGRRVDQRFLRWATRGPLWQTEVDRLRNVGAVFDSLNVRDIARLRIALPSLRDQKAVADVLGALDDKLMSNRRISEIAERLTASEFAGRFGRYRTRRHDGGLPTGWRFGPLSDLCELVKQSVQPSERPDVLFEHFSIPAFDAGASPELVPGTEMLSSKTPLPTGDVILLSKLNPSSKRVWWPRPRGEGDPVCSPEFLVLAARAPVPVSYVHAVVAHDEAFYKELLSHATGTTGSRQRVKPRDALACEVLIPSADALGEWDEFARSLRALISGLLAEAETLRRVRDELLPPLVAGQLRIQQVASDVGHAREEAFAS